MLDLSFVQLPLDNPWLETLLVLQDDYVLVSAADSPFPAERRTPALREIAEQPLIGYRSCRATELVFDQLRASGHEPQLRLPLRRERGRPGARRRRDRRRDPPAPRGRPERRRDPDHRPEPAHRRARRSGSRATRTGTTRPPRGRSSRRRSRSAPRPRRRSRRELLTGPAQPASDAVPEIPVELRLVHRRGEMEALAERAAALEQHRHLGRRPRSPRRCTASRATGRAGRTCR